VITSIRSIDGESSFSMSIQSRSGYALALRDLSTGRVDNRHRPFHVARARTDKRTILRADQLDGRDSTAVGQLIE
jgi:hypothetical protein